MRTRMLAVAALIAAVAAAFVPTGAGESTSAPSLKLLRAAPLRVAGAHFRPRERVRVTVSFGARRVHTTLTASQSGAFVVGFKSRAGRCETVTGFALGRAGSRAAFKRGPPPACQTS